MNIVGLDLSLTATGVCLLDTADDIAAPDCVVLSTVESQKPKGKNLPKEYEIDRLATLRYEIIREAHKHGIPNLIVIESPSFLSQSTSSDKLWWLSWEMRRWCWSNQVDWLMVAPSQLKKFVTGKGTAEKSQILKAVFQRWNIDAADDNQADAAVLAKIGQAWLYPDAELLSFQADVLAKLRAKQ